jgi:nitroimidazol reductase NimA-like FMN-containing flavoprotein (pyridoxamine 5'-phosphate oxidase superfamily)
MPNSTFNRNFTKIRRSKKSITDQDQIKSFLHRVPVGVLATVFEDQPFLSTKLFIYDENDHAIYLHSANEGRVYENIHLNSKVCFTAFEMGRFLPDSKASGFGVEYESVVVFGHIQVIEDQQKMISVLQKFMDKYASHLKPGEDYLSIQIADLQDLAVYQIGILDWSAKRDQEDIDHPGAYKYEYLGVK